MQCLFKRGFYTLSSSSDAYTTIPIGIGSHFKVVRPGGCNGGIFMGLVEEGDELWKNKVVLDN